MVFRRGWAPRRVGPLASCCALRRSGGRCQPLAAALVTLINRQPIESAEIETSYVVTVTCRGLDEAKIRALVQGFGVSDLHLRELESTDIEGTERVEVTATLTSQKRREIALEYIVGSLSLDPSVTAARWRVVNSIV
jgi:putative Mg2+ transporter-C (MgtC) family protein